MATSKKPAAKTATKGKTAPKAAVPARKVVKKAAAPARNKAVAVKTAAKSVSKKPVSKKAPVKPVKKATPAAKPTPAKKKVVAAAKPALKKKIAVKASTTNHKKTASAKAAPAKKAVPAKKAAVPAKKAAPAPVKKAAPAKPAPKAAPKKAAPAPVAKKAPPAPVKKAAPAPAPAAPVKKAAPAPAPVKASSKKAPVKKTVTVIARPAGGSQQPATPSPAPRPTVREEKKPNVIIAHRRLESKRKESDSSGKTMINYQPDFTRSILDEVEQQQGPVYRYSDEELAEFKELILGRLESARKELAYLQGLITRKDEAGTEDTENRYMNMEDGSGAMEREQLAQLASRQIQFINHLEKAMIRIENKTYGICRVTGKLIDKARLRAVPHATLSIEAKKMMTK